MSQKGVLIYPHHPFSDRRKNKKNTGRIAEEMMIARAEYPIDTTVISSTRTKRSQTAKLFLSQICRGRFAGYLLEAATKIFGVGIAHLIGDLGNREIPGQHELDGPFEP